MYCHSRQFALETARNLRSGVVTRFSGKLDDRERAAVLLQVPHSARVRSTFRSPPKLTHGRVTVVSSLRRRDVWSAARHDDSGCRDCPRGSSRQFPRCEADVAGDRVNERLDERPARCCQRTRRSAASRPQCWQASSRSRVLRDAAQSRNPQSRRRPVRAVDRPARGD